MPVSAIPIVWPIPILKLYLRKLLNPMNAKLSILLLLLSVSNIAVAQDLIVTDITGPKTSDQYEIIYNTVTTKNNGIIDITESSFVFLYLSVDDQWDNDDYRIGHVYISSIRAGETLIATPSPYYSTNIPSGKYNLIAKADFYNDIDETEEGNNILVIPDYTIQQPNVDFMFTSFSIPDKIAVYDKLMPSFTLQNSGTTDIFGQVSTKFFLSKDDQLDNGDTLLGYYLSDLTAVDTVSNMSQPWNSFFMFPTPPGNYYIIGQVDNSIYYGTSDFNETNESNNIVAQPVTVVAPDIDLSLSPPVGDPVYNNGYFYLPVQLSNKGKSGALGYKFDVYLSTDNSFGNDDIYFARSEGYTFSSYYVGPGNSMNTYLTSFDFKINPFDHPGSYYVVIVVNPDHDIPEGNYADNINISTQQLYIMPEVFDVQVTNPNFLEVYNENDRSLSLEATFTNHGDQYYSGELFNIWVRDQSGVFKSYDVTWVSASLSPGENRPITIDFELEKYLPAGTYQVSFTAMDHPIDFVASLTILPLPLTIKGSVVGEDNVPINRGNLFLYHKESSTIFLSQKTSLTTSDTFSIKADYGTHTLYFIPDKDSFPGYVPTILGKTVTIQPTSFFNLQKDTSLIFEVLKLNNLGSGSKVISGNVGSGNNNGRLHGAVVQVQSFSSLPVILMNEAGDVVALTQTDVSGYFEFRNLPDAKYKIVVAFELNEAQMTTPVTVDVTSHNAVVDVKASVSGVSATAKFKQEIVFAEFATATFNDEPILLTASTNATLDISYTSSNPSIAAVQDDKIVILGAGTVDITAQQSGNDQFTAASSTRTLTINKASQSITFADFGPAHVSEDITLSATSTSGLPITFTSSNTTVATVDGNILTIHAAGSAVITASQNGNDNYQPAGEVSKPVDIVILGIDDPLAQLTISPNPAKASLKFNQEISATSVQFTDLAGRTSILPVIQSTIDVTNFSRGMYLLKIHAGTKSRVIKVILD